MPSPFDIKKLRRSLGIVAVFTVLGPVVVAACLLLAMLAIGIPLLLFFLIFVDFESLRPYLSVGLFVFVMFCMLATLPPAFFSGIAFAITSVCFGANSLRVAIVCAALAGVGIVIMGALVSVSESSALLLPKVEGLGQALGMSVFLIGLAALAASICWMATRKLHRLPS